MSVLYGSRRRNHRFVRPSRRVTVSSLSSSIEPVERDIVNVRRSAGSPFDFKNGERMLGKSKHKSRSLETLIDNPKTQSAVTSITFRREIGEETLNTEFSSVQSYALLENPEKATRWYFKYFLGRVHQNFLCYDNEKTPFFLSVVCSGDSLYRCILWRKKGNKRLCIQYSGKVHPPPKAILEKFNIQKYDKTIKDISSASLQKDFLTLEEQEGAVSFKFGVLLAKSGQTIDDEMFSNREGSPSFTQFLSLLGETVNLKGWTHFRGGLDHRNDATGTQSVYTVFGGHELMFHVSTMLPYSHENKQQLERKRHIGNDIVVIVFIDEEEKREVDTYSSALSFNPSSITSHFNHIFAIVTYNKHRDTYRLVLYSAENIPAFGPPLPPGGEFYDHLAFRDFLLAKLINGEKAAYCISTFADKRERTLGLLMKDVEHKCTTELRKSLTQITSPNNSKKYQELEHSFCEVGNKIKIDRIVSGHHPTSQITTAHKREPWETVLILQNFPYKVVCGDSCGDGTIFVSTASDGTHMIFGDGTSLHIIDKSLPIAQLAIAHRHGLLLFRTGHSKDNYVYAVPLEIFYTESVKIRNKAMLSTYQLPYTKGCHIFCTTPLDSQFLRIMVAVRTKVFLLVWKHPAISFFPTTPTSPQHPLEGFVKHRELTLSEVPISMSFLDDHPSGKLCVMYQKQIEAIDEMSTETQKLYSYEPSKVNITEMRAVQTNSRNELLLGYNMTCSVLSLQDGMVFNSPEIVWNAEPKQIVYTPLYIIAFTTDTIEIRKSTNGSLMHTIDVPQLNLIAHKDDIIFTSPSLLSQSLSRNNSVSSRLEGKAAKVLGKSNPSNTTVNIYRISSENLIGTGRLSVRSHPSSERDEGETSSSDSRCSVSMGGADTPSSSIFDVNDSGLQMIDSSSNLSESEASQVFYSPQSKRMVIYPEGYHGNQRDAPPISEHFEDSVDLLSSAEGSNVSVFESKSSNSLQGLHDSYSSSPSILNTFSSSSSPSLPLPPSSVSSH